jgi:hypothetical protein
MGDGARQGGGTVETLRRLLREHRRPRLSLDDLLDALGDQGFGLLVLALALPNAVPGPMIPGFSLPFAVGIAVLGVQLMAGLKRPNLPGWLRRRSVSRDGFERFVERAEPRLLRIERLIRPRRSWLTAGPGERIVGGTLVLLSLVLALPVPLGNLPVALATSVIALGLLEGDGLALALGLAGGAAAALWNAAIIFAGAELLALVAHYFN